MGDIGPIKIYPSIGPIKPTATVGLTEAVSDSFTLSDSLGGNFWDQSSSDSFTCVDSARIALDLKIVVIDSFSCSDAQNWSAGIPSGSVDSFGFSDSIAVDLEIDPNFKLNFSDVLDFEDGPPQTNINAPIFDSIDFEDSILVSIGGITQIAVGDSITLVDQMSFPMGLGFAFGDSLDLEDLQLYDNLAFTDGLIFNDQVFLFFGGEQVGDQFTISDNFIWVVSIEEPISDSITLAEGVNFLVDIPLTFGDHLLFTDLAVFVIPRNINPNTQFPPSIDNILFSDNIQIYLGFVGFSDSLILSDGVQIATFVAEDLSDVLVFSDNVTVLLISTIVEEDERISDLLALADAVRLGLTGNETKDLIDAFAFSDNIALGLGLVCNDSADLSDSLLTAFRENYQTPADTVSLSDGIVVGLASEIGVVVNDDLILADRINSIGPTVTDTEYIRRYLNDVLNKG